MERLTQWDEFGNADIIALSDIMPELYAELDFSETNALTDVLNLLGTYEDTNLTPPDIRDLRNELCLRCGNYKRAHLGACDGCRWKQDAESSSPASLPEQAQKVIAQLEDLRKHCRDFEGGDDPDDVWKKDISALTEAISAIAKLHRLKATDAQPPCSMCLTAESDPDGALTVENDFSAHSVGEHDRDFRIMLEAGGGHPLRIVAERWLLDHWSMVAAYEPPFCPNCGRQLKETTERGDAK